MNMYNLSHLDDDALLRDFASLLDRDRRTTARLLAHIAEIDDPYRYGQVLSGFDLHLFANCSFRICCEWNRKHRHLLNRRRRPEQSRMGRALVLEEAVLAVPSRLP